MEGEMDLAQHSRSYDWLLSLSVLQAVLVLTILVSGQGATWALAGL